MTDTSYSSRDAVEAAVQTHFIAVADILDLVQADASLYPAGLSAGLDRARRFASTMASTLAPPAAVPETTEQAVIRLCAAVDAERDRRTALDFIHDFGETQAVDDDGQVIAAGVRSLQMREADRANWQAFQGAALTAVISGQADAVLPMRAEDNWNIQTTATQALQVLAAVIAHGSALLFHGGALKSAIRAAEDPTSVDIMAGWPEQP